MPRPKTSGNKKLRWKVEEFMPTTGEIVSMNKFTSLFTLADFYNISRNTATRLHVGSLVCNQRRHRVWKHRRITLLCPEFKNSFARNGKNRSLSLAPTH